MIPKVRLPKQSNTIALYASDHIKAIHLAYLFMGGKGKIANVIDVIKARLEYGFDHPLWNSWITTSSTEWFGLDEKGNKVIVTLHDSSPLIQNKKLCSEYKDTSRDDKHPYNLVNREMFLKILYGDYGPVSVVQYKDVIESYNKAKHPNRFMDLKEARNSPLLKARLGHCDPYDPSINGLTADYLSYHSTESIKRWLGKNNGVFDDPETFFLRSDLEAYRDHFAKYSKDRYFEWEDNVVDLNAYGLGHFIVLGGIKAGLSTDTYSKVSISTRNGGGNFLVTMYDEKMRFDKNLYTYSKTNLSSTGKLFIPHSSEGNKYYRIVEDQEGWMFTVKEKSKTSLTDNGTLKLQKNDVSYTKELQKEFLIKSAKRLCTRNVIITSDGEKEHFTYKDVFEHNGVNKANAFKKIGSVKINGTHTTTLTFKVEFYYIEVYTDRIIATEDEIISDHKLLGRVIKKEH